MDVSLTTAWSRALVYFDDPKWMDHITFNGEAGQPLTAS
jgi:hypothetical protein